MAAAVKLRCDEYLTFPIKGDKPDNRTECQTRVRRFLARAAKFAAYRVSCYYVYGCARSGI